VTRSAGPGSYAPRSQPRKIAGNCRRHLRKVRYNPIEHGWGVLESPWNGTLLNSVAKVVEWAGTMTWKGTRPIVKRIETTCDKGVRIAKDAFRTIESRLQRHDSLPKYDVLIRPQPV
jgi:hypothetical protein